MNCFARAGATPETDISDMPENPEKERAKFFRDSRMAEEIPAADYREQIRGNMRVLPRSACPGKCSGEGECLSNSGSSPYCLCYPGFTGNDCSQYVSQCYNGCSGKGTCIRGVCSCQPGWFGLDCSVDLSRRASLPEGGMTVMADPPVGDFNNAPAPVPEREPNPESQSLNMRMYNRLKARRRCCCVLVVVFLLLCFGNSGFFLRGERVRELPAASRTSLRAHPPCPKRTALLCAYPQVKIWIVETPPWLGEGHDRDFDPTVRSWETPPTPGPHQNRPMDTAQDGLASARHGMRCNGER